MIKLFIRNKCVEIGNAIYDNSGVIIDILKGILVVVSIGIGFALVSYILSDIAPYIPIIYPKIVINMASGTLTSRLEAGGAVFALLLLAFVFVMIFWYTTGKFISWIKDNIQKAKNGFKVNSHWK